MNIDHMSKLPYSGVLKIQNTFCPVPWTELTIDHQGYFNLCCQNIKTILGHISEVDDLEEFFNTRLADLREKQIMDGYIPDSCKHCYEKELKKIPNHRSAMLGKKYQIDPFSFDKQRAYRLDICFSNLCNQQCLMCNSQYSTKWLKDDTRLKNKFDRIPTTYSRSLTEEDVDKIKKLNPHTVIVKGGEPTIDPLFKRYIKGLKSNVRMVSNFQQVTDELMDDLANLPSLHLVVSVDGTGDLYNWVRGGDYNKVVANLKKFIPKAQKTLELIFTCAYNVYNIEYADRCLKDIEELGFDCSINNRFVYYPNYTSPFILPKEKRVEIYNSIQTKYKPDFECLLEDYPYSEDLINKSMQWAKEIDRIRGFTR